MTIYEKNLEALKKGHPELVELIEAVELEEDTIKVVSSEEGEPTILFKKDNGEEVYIHSKEDPVARAHNAVDVVEKLGKEGIIILCGFGLGYFAEEILKRFEKSHVLVIYEATPELFKAAMQTRDISEMLENDKVNIFIGDSPTNLYVFHKYYHIIYSGKLLVVKHHPSISLNPDLYDRFIKVVRDEQKIAGGQMVTGISRGREFIDSDMANIPVMIRMPGVKELKNAFEGTPGIVVSAGPSLDINCHLLKKVKGKAVIVATDAALPTLLPYDIIPDFVVAVEASIKTMYMFKNNPLLKKVPLIALSTFNTDVVRMYPGPVLVNYAPGSYVSALLEGFRDEKGFIPSGGGSVAHLAFSVVDYLGCKTIALIGQDLSFNTERFHSHGFANMLNMLEMDIAFLSKNIFDEDIYTRGDLFMYKVSFERKIPNFDGTVVQATEGGLPIDGAVTMRLTDFIDEYCLRTPKTDIENYIRMITEKPVRYNLKGIAGTIKNLRDIFKTQKKKASKLLRYIDRVEKLNSDGKRESNEFHNTLAKIEVLTEGFKHATLNLLVGYNLKLEYYLKKFEVKTIDEIEDEWDRLEKQLERGRKYFSEIIETIGTFNIKLDRLVSELQTEKKINEILIDESLDEREKFFKAGMMYRKAGIVAQAVKYFESCRPLYKTPSLDMLIHLSEMYLKQFRCYEAKELLSLAKGLKHSKQKDKGKTQAEKIKDLLDACDEMLNRWEEHKSKIEKVLRLAEEKYGGHLESGYFYFRTKDYERAEKAYLKAVTTAQKDKSGMADAYYGLAHTYLAQNETGKAVGALEKAVEAEPANPIFYRDLGFIAFQNNDMASAELFFTKSVELAPRTVELYKPLADLYVVCGNIEKAIVLYEDALLANPGNAVIQQELMALYRDKITEAGRKGTA